MLMPKKVKYRKQHRGRMTGKAWRGSTVSFGDYGMKALEPCWLTDRQIEAARVAMTRFIKRGGKIWVRVFPDKPITKSRRKHGWERARAHRSNGLPSCGLGGFSSRWRESVRPDAERAMQLASAKLPDPHQIHDAIRRGDELMANLGELREMGSEDLVLRVTQLDNEVFRLRMQQGMGQGDKPNKMKQLKRERARARRYFANGSW